MKVSKVLDVEALVAEYKAKGGKVSYGVYVAPKAPLSWPFMSAASVSYRGRRATSLRSAGFAKAK